MESKQPRLKMLVGLPGSGKSTYIDYLVKEELQNENVAIISTDNYIETKASEEDVTYSEAFDKYIKKASVNMKSALKDAIKFGQDIIWDQTNLTPKSRKKKLKMIPDIYFKEAIVFDVSDDVLEERLKKRGDATGKVIPSHVLDNMKDGFLMPTLEEGFDKITKL